MWAFLKSVKSGVKSYITPEPNSNYLKDKWTSVILFFNYKNRTIVDTVLLIIGNIPDDYPGYYLNFTRFKVIDDKLYYINEYEKAIDPKNVHLHIKQGCSDFGAEYLVKNKTYWHLYFSSLNNKLYDSIKDQLGENIVVYDLTETYPGKRKIKIEVRNIRHPLFKKHQYYGEDLEQGLFSRLMVEKLMN